MGSLPQPRPHQRWQWEGRSPKQAIIRCLEEPGAGQGSMTPTPGAPPPKLCAQGPPRDAVPPPAQPRAPVRHRPPCPEFRALHTFFSEVGFLALGTSLCFPFFTRGALESRGLCGVFGWLTRWPFLPEVASLERTGTAPTKQLVGGHIRDTQGYTSCNPHRTPSSSCHKLSMFLPQ